jgi:hypothetical protein
LCDREAGNNSAWFLVRSRAPDKVADALARRASACGLEARIAQSWTFGNLAVAQIKVDRSDRE